MSSSLSARLRSTFGRFGCTLAAVAALAGCGGSVVDEFEPARIVSLGDEYSYIDGATGRKYTVNALGSDGVSVDCGANRIWNQRVVESYGFAFAQCNPQGRDTSRALLLATVGAKSADLATQIGRVSGLGENDLALLLIGANDVWAGYDTARVQGEAAALAQMDTAANAAYAQILRLVNLKVKVVVLTLPDIGRSPHAVKTLGNPDLVSRLVARFNVTLRSKLSDESSPTSDGRKLGLVLAEDMVGLMQKNLGDYGLSNGSDAACDSASYGLACDSSKAVGDYGDYLYADDRHFSIDANDYIGRLTETRAKDSPF